FVSHAVLPVLASRQSASRARSLVALSLIGTAVVRYTRPLTTTGDDQPLPGSSCFQATFFVGSHSVGKEPDGTRPWPVGPRNSGQSSACRVGTKQKAAVAASAKNDRVMRKSSGRGRLVGWSVRKRKAACHLLGRPRHGLGLDVVGGAVAGVYASASGKAADR